MMRSRLSEIGTTTAYILLGIIGLLRCVPDFSDIPCVQDENCPSDMVCVRGFCDHGKRDPDGGVAGDGGTTADSGTTNDAGTTADSGTTSDAGTSRTNGESCSVDGECKFGHCVGKICCDSQCGPCGTCATGSCSPLGTGAAGAPPCSPYVCGASVICPTTCAGDTQCVGTAYCAGSACVPRKDNGATCEGENQCKSNHCDNKLCCASGNCCSAAAACPASFHSAATCTDSSSSTTCQGTRKDATCVDFACGSQVVDDDSACSGATRACNLYKNVVCSAATSQPVAACATSCTGPSDCSTGNTCAGGACVPIIAETFRGVWGFAENDVWIVGEHGHVMHWDGSRWSVSLSQSNYQLYGVWGVSSSDLWAVGYDSSAVAALTLHWNGSQWSVKTNGASAGDKMYGVSGTSSSDVWVVGGGGCCGLVHHWTGSAFGTPTSFGRGPIHSVIALSSTDAWAAGENGGSVFRLTGSTWALVTGVPGGEFRAIWASTSSDVTALSGQAVAHWAGSSWSETSLSTYGTFNGLFGLGSNSLWAVGNAGVVIQSSYPGSWSTYSNSPTQDLYGVWGRPGSSAFVLWVAGHGVVLHWQQGSSGLVDITPPGVVPF